MKIKVMLFANNDSIRKSISHLLEHDSSLIIEGVYRNTRHAAYQVKTKMPEVVIIESDLQEVIGIGAVKSIKNAVPQIHIIIVTTIYKLKVIYNTFKAGASGYLLKSNLNDNLIRAINEVMNGGVPMSPQIAKKVLHILMEPEAIATESLINYRLTPREQEILSLLKDGLSYKMIMGELDIKYETVRSHMKNIYVKLNVSSLTEVVAKVITEKIA